MAAEDFFARWSKKNSEGRPEKNAETAAPGAPLPQASVPAAASAAPLPTLEDAERLTPDADFSAFMAQGVDELVKRTAMKKLFTDPHFNIMDGLDTYIDDYNKFEALTPDIVATLNHAKALLDPLSQSAAPAMQLLDALDDEQLVPARVAQSETPSDERVDDMADSAKQPDDGLPRHDDPQETEQAGSPTPPVSD
jgi:hypothetical protein